MRQYLGEPGGPIALDPAAKRLAMQKMAIEVAWRILGATRSTPPPWRRRCCWEPAAGR